MDERFYPVEDFCNDKIKLEKSAEIIGKIKSIVDGKYTEKSKISVMGVGRTKTKKGFDGNQVYLAGGLNGNGDWADYLEDMSKIVRELRNSFSEAENIVVANMEFDLLDDIFYPVVDIVYSYDKEE